MPISHKPFILFTLIFLSCDTGKLELVASLNNSIAESSGLEIVKGSNLLWTIQDSGNRSKIYGINLNGSIVKEISITNAKNIDWEDLTTDVNGNLYVGDFGNNNKSRKKFTIYKINLANSLGDEIRAESIHFKLPKKMKSEDFESFFLLNGHFYIFSKEHNIFRVLKVPNEIGNHTAVLFEKFNLKGKHNQITSAALSPDRKTVVLLNHDKLWKITGFELDHFFKGTIEEITFEHSSQKEGICFFGNKILYISDERNGPHGGNIYKFGLED